MTIKIISDIIISNRIHNKRIVTAEAGKTKRYKINSLIYFVSLFFCFIEYFMERYYEN